MKFYRIRVKGLLDPTWSERFEGLTITADGENATLLEGELQDDARLHAILRMILNLNLSILTLEQIIPGGQNE